jgi:anthranilate/para-aminobenzoate synthase component I
VNRVDVNALLDVIPGLERPLVWLEDGMDRGLARLAWGARARYRLGWSDTPGDRLADLRPPAGRRVYGVLAYDLGLPPRAARRRPAVAQPMADLFEPENEFIIGLARRETVTGIMPGGQAVGAVERLGGWSAGPPVRRSARLIDRSFDQAGFESAVRAVKDHIAAGDVYQVNLSVAERFAVDLSPWEVYLRLRQINPSPWMGFADFGDWQLVSGSPELLVEMSGDQRTGGPVVRTRPIAGTRKKTGDPARDGEMRTELRLDEKEQAEHRMLLDLARNDLGRVCEFGSVRVSEREVIEEYSHVFHLVSEVVGVARPGVTPWDAVRAVFPGGTITGAPKIRAMEIIAELEPVGRGAYTGGLGWLGAGGGQVNILIRSAVFREGQASVQAGAGVVWDSDPAREWRESLRKASAMRLALGGTE